MQSHPKSTLQIWFKSIQTKSQSIHFIFIDISKLKRKYTKTRFNGMRFLYAFIISSDFLHCIGITLDFLRFFKILIQPFSKSFISYLPAHLSKKYLKSSKYTLSLTQCSSPWLSAWSNVMPFPSWVSLLSPRFISCCNQFFQPT